MRLNKISLAALACGASMFLAACGGGGGNDNPLRPVTLATTDLTADISAVTIPVLLDQLISFSTGISQLGTSSLTTLMFSGLDTSKPSFDLESDGYKATGEMTYASCTFKIVTSTYPASFPALQVGVTTAVNPCDITALTRGFLANGISFNTTMKVRMGDNVGTKQPVTLSISPAGVVTWYGQQIGKVAVVATTGAGN